MHPLLNIAVRAARRAGEIIVRSLVRLESLEVTSKGRNDYVSEIDRAAEREIIDIVRKHYPEHAILAEESGRSGEHDTVWIIDPLDGTNEFGEQGRDDWAVHVALVQEGRLAAGAVALPALGRTFSTRSARMVQPPTRRLRVAVSRSRPPREAQVLVDRLDAELCAMGSAGAKAMTVVSGTVDAYVHSGGQYEWDSAAPVAVATAAGLHASRLDGSELEYNKPSPWLPDLLICREELRAPILAALA